MNITKTQSGIRSLCLNAKEQNPAIAMPAKTGFSLSRLSIIFLVVTVAIVAAQAARAQSWTTLEVGTTSDLHAIVNGSFSDCWLAGQGGFVAQALDCTNFAPVDVGPAGADLRSISRNSAVDIWIGGVDGRVRRLVLGLWEGRDIPGGTSSGEVFWLFSRNSGASWAAGDQGSLFRNPTGDTNDWQLNYAAGVALYGGSGFIDSTAIVVGANGLILTTTNGGTNWSLPSSGTTEDLFAHTLVNGGDLIVGALGTVLKSTDGGATWTSKTSGTTEALRAVAVSPQNSSRLLAVGDGGITLRSIDAGETWCFLHTTLQDWNAVEMLSNNAALLAGDQGLLLRTDNGGGVCQAEPLVPIFVDGFESGDTSVWSSAMP